MNPESPTNQPDWLDALPVSQVAEGQVAEAVVDGEILAIGCADGQYFALDGICSHQGGSLGKGALTGCTLTCPWHGWQYDVRTGKQVLSERIAQRVYATRVLGDTIQVCRV